MTRLSHDTVATGRIDGAKNRADVVRILDAVEHDEQRCGGSGRFDNVAQRVVARIVDLGDDPLMHTATRQALDHLRAGALDWNAGLPCDPQRIFEAAIASRTDAHPPHPSVRSASSTGLMP